MRDHVAMANQYIADVLSGAVPACKWVKAACRRQLDDLEAAATDPHYPFRFDLDRARHVCRFIELLRHVKGQWAGTTITLEPWQAFILTTVFGWLTREDTRRFRIVYIEVPRKNAKSTLTSGVALYMLGPDREAGAECYTAATTRDQAGIVFQDARRMAIAAPEYRHRFGVDSLRYSLAIDDLGSVLRALSAEGDNLEGLNIHFASVDELHAHKTRAVWDVLENGMGARRQPLLWAITTAGSNREGICYEQRNYVTSVLNGTLRRHDGLGYKVGGNVAEDDTYFGICYSIDDDDDWTEELAWKKANPNYGISVQADDMRRLAGKAAKIASARNNFLTKRLNVWVNQATAWLDMRAWDRCADPDLTLDEMRDLECVCALDLASKVDIAAAVKVFHRRGHYYVFSRFWVPEAQVHEDDRHTQYAGWVEDGWLTATAGNVTDYDLIEQSLRDAAAAHKVVEVPFDPWQATHLANHMLAEKLPMVECRQTVQTMSEPMKTVEALVLEGKLHHDGNPVLAWMMANVVCYRDAKDNVYPRKEGDANKIDGAVALIMAIGAWLRRQPKVSVYETRGVRAL